MKKNKYLGLSRDGRCCILESHLTFAQIEEHAGELEPSDFIHSSTNWCGCDDEGRTLRILNLQKTGNDVVLPHTLCFTGSDDDMGHSYAWRFDVSEIVEIKPK